MIRNASKLSLVALLALSMAACGPSETTDNNANNTNNTNNVTPDAGDNNDPDTGDNNDPDAGGPECTTDDDCSGDTPVCENEVCVAAPPEDLTAPKCDDTPQPADCAADPATKSDWAPSSVADSLTVIQDTSCCYDYDGDGLNDNSLGSILSLLGADDVQGGIDDAIGDGDIALVMAHIGLDAADNDDEFTIGFLLGEPIEGWVDNNTDDAYEFQPDPAGGNAYLVAPESFDQGAYPQAVALAELTNGEVAAGPGRVTLQLELFGITLSLGVSQVRITADVGAASNLTDGTGVQLEDGTLGGIVKITEVYDAVNDFAANNCGCLPYNNDYSGDLIPYDPANLAGGACTSELDTAGVADACPDDPNNPDDLNGICRTIATDVCGNISAIGFLLDQYTEDPARFCFNPDPDENTPDCDGISLGIEFTAAGAKIDGVAAAD
jgi:hypothetical protein